jgi:hypothetical protein
VLGQLLEARELLVERANLARESFLDTTGESNRSKELYRQQQRQAKHPELHLTLAEKQERDRALLYTFLSEAQPLEAPIFKDIGALRSRVSNLENQRSVLLNDLHLVEKELSVLASQLESAEGNPSSVTSSSASSRAESIISSLGDLENSVSVTIHRRGIALSPRNNKVLSLDSLDADAVSGEKLVVVHLSEYLAVEMRCATLISERVRSNDERKLVLSAEIREYEALRMPALIADIEKSLFQLQQEKEEDIASIVSLLDAMETTFSPFEIGVGGVVSIGPKVLGTLLFVAEAATALSNCLELIGVESSRILRVLSQNISSPHVKHVNQSPAKTTISSRLNHIVISNEVDIAPSTQRLSTKSELVVSPAPGLALMPKDSRIEALTSLKSIKASIPVNVK